jgi:hypothetical protein
LKALLALLIIAFGLGLTACFSDDDIATTTGTTTTTTTTTTTETPPGPTASIMLAADPDSIAADGASSTTITATLRDVSGHAVAVGTSVTFLTTLGAFPGGTTSHTVTTRGDSGIVNVSLMSSATAGTATVTATSNSVTQTVPVEFTTEGATALVGSVILEATSTTGAVANGLDSYTITAQVLDTLGQPLSGQSVTFSYSGNSGLVAIDPLTSTAVADGTVSCEVTDISSAADTMTISASAGGVTSALPITLTFIGAAGGGTGSVGSVTVTAGSAEIVADGASSTLITATVKDTDGKNIGDGTTVTFSTTAGTLSGATTTASGKATVTLTSPTNLGSATIMATCGGVSKSTSVSFIAGPVTALNLTAKPSNLSADGIQTSTIEAAVSDTNGNPVSSEFVNFSVVSGAISISLAVTDSSGIATIIYTAPDTVPVGGTDTITATSSNGTTNTVTITLIAPLVGSVTVTAGSAEIAADGASSTLITAAVKDTANNNIPDGTPVTFTTTAGDIDSVTAGTQTTIISNTASGKATVTLTSSTSLTSATITATVGGVSGNTSVSFIPGPVNTIVLTATPSTLIADGLDVSDIKAAVTDAQGHVVADGETISFSVTAGTGSVSDPFATTSKGVATVTYTASTTAGIETVTAQSGTVSDTVNITLTAPIVGSVTVTSISSEIVANGASSTLITAAVKDTKGNNIPEGTVVNFSTTAGTLSGATTTANGKATVTLTSSTNLGSATVTAIAGGVSGNTSVSFIPGPVNTIVLTATPGTLPADGSSESEIKAVATDAQAHIVADGETISFSVTAGTGSVSAPTATTSNGVATVTYTASTTAGIETVTAQSGTVSDTVNITLAAPLVGSVTVTAGSAEIVADGASSTLITAAVKDTKGNNMADGTTVNFTTSAGTLSAPSATTAGGVASVFLTSPTNVGSADITADVGGVSGTTSVSFIAGAPATVTVSAAPANLTADGTSTSTIEVTVLDANNNPVADGETLLISSLSGTLSAFTASTEGGMADITYTAPNYVPASGNDTITVEATNGQSGTAVITLIGPQIASISLSANPTSLPADGTSQCTITATVTVVGGGSAPDGTTVDFSITQGGGSITATASTAGGLALATLTSGVLAETATIRAEAGGRIAEIDVVYTPGSVTLTIVPNSLLGTGQETAVVTAVLKDAAGNPAPNGETVTFVLSDESLGDITSPATTSGGQGEATTTFYAAAKGGTVTITATWSPGGVDVTGSETITIQPPPAFIEVAEGYPEPTYINIKGTGGQSTSQVVFNIKDAQGALVADGYRVDFTILSGPDGGEEISPLFDTTVSGQVGTILRSGYKSGPVSIKVTYYYDTNISTTTSQISIVAGPPVGEEFGVSARYLNISGFWKTGLEDQITISANDIYGNAIPDNTTISFKTYATGGDFVPGSSLTGVDPNPSGIATSTLLSYEPKPTEGFLSVTAEAVNGGRTTHVTSIAVNPSDNDIIYAGTDGGGVYKSLDNGDSWGNISRSSTEQGQNWIDPYVNDISIDPDDINTVYAATGYLGKGNIYRSLDGGLNWNSGNTEEWNGVVSVTAAMLTVLCDDTGSDYVWAGTKGMGAIFASDGETFQWGGTVTAPVLASFVGADGTMSTPTLSVASKTETWTTTFQQTGAAPSTPALDTTATGSAADGTMTGVSATSTAGTETWTVTYTGGFAGGIVPSGDGTGTLAVVSTSPNTITESWTVTCTNGTDGSETFSVLGSQTGLHDPITNIYQNYSSDNNEVTFYILESGAFVVGSQFTFSTTHDGWSVTGSVSGAQQAARTDIPYTSDNSEVSFTINSGANRFYEQDDTWTFDTTITGNWVVAGTVSGTQSDRAYNDLAYTSDNSEVSFTITEGTTPFGEGDTFTFTVTESGLGLGKSVRDIVKVPGTNGASAVLYAGTTTGVFRSSDGGLLWSKPGDFTGDMITTLAVHPASTGGVNDVIYAGTEDSGVWVSTNSGAAWTNYPGGMGKGLSASTPLADLHNTGNGVMSEVTVGAAAVSEYWTVTCITPVADGGTFSVTGTVSGAQANATVGVLYTSGGGEISFTISDGNVDFAAGDSFTFATSRDLGKTIKDLLVDGGNDTLYAITYFWGPLEPHAVGNVYVHDLNAGGTMAVAAPGAWSEANTGLPQFDPPDDTTLFAQHVMALDIEGAPTALYIGGEGINLYKATSDLTTGALAWKQSTNGLTNLIMARMPILFSGICEMYISEERDGNNVTYTVYIEDVNGNPPIYGSAFSVVLKPPVGEKTTLLDLDYPDAYTYTGTWRDLSDPDTNNPYIIQTPVYAGDEVIFTFNPACLDEAPGCSGSDQILTYSY